MNVVKFSIEFERIYKIGFVLALIFLVFGCKSHVKKEQNSLLVYCAASLTDVVTELKNDFEEETGASLKLSFASSGTLARQIENGADPALYISANKKWFDYLEEKSLLVPGTGKEIAGNRMVLVAPTQSDLDAFPFSVEMDLPKTIKGKLAIGDPQHVPAGIYAMQIIERLGWKSKLEPKLLTTVDVRSALMLVELGEADAGIVYKTDALKSDKVKIITEFPGSLHDDVDYYMALVKGAGNNLSNELYNYICSDRARIIWEKYGFEK